LLSAASIYEDKATPRLHAHKFLNIGYASDGDWIVIDVSTQKCTAGLLSHDEWNPWVEDQGDPRDAFHARTSLEELLTEGVDTSTAIWREHEESTKAAARRKPLTFSSLYKPERKCEYTSVPVPDGYKVKGDTSSTIWISPEGRKGGMVVSRFGLQHAYVKDAQEGRANFRDFWVGRHHWYLAMPDARDRYLDSFMAILPLSDVAIAVYASNFYWSESDLRSFLAAIEVDEGRETGTTHL
jgi:hypothetical protein